MSTFIDTKLYIVDAFVGMEYGVMQKKIVKRIKHSEMMLLIVAPLRTLHIDQNGIVDA